MKEIILNIDSKEVRLAKLRHKRLHDLVIERKKTRRLAGNIYKGRVTNILHNIQSAFIDIGEGENGFIHISDILTNTQKFQEMFDIDFDWEGDIDQYDTNKPTETDITKLLNPDQMVLVQVVKEPIGSKGARLTSNISIPGRYLVLLPGSPHRGVSKKITDPGVREQLKQTIKAFEMPGDVGLICRTASMWASRDQLIDEATQLLQTWTNLIDQFENETTPTTLFQESDIVKRALMGALDKKYDRLLTDHYPTYLSYMRLLKRYQNSDHPLKVEFYRDKVPMFERFGIEKELEKALQKKVWLPSGGYLFFERTEAMHTIDVNSGRSNKASGSKDVEETLVQINMEAADEIAKQLSIRNIGGLIICDFIDMRSRKSQRRVLDRFKEAMKEDSAKCTILGMSEFGLVEMTRQRSRESLAQTLFMNCPYCSGNGVIKNFDTMAIEIERALKKLIQVHEEFAVRITCHPQLDQFLDKGEKKHLIDLAEKMHAELEFSSDDTLHLNEFIFSSTLNGRQLSN